MNSYAVVLQLGSGQSVLWQGSATDRYQAKLAAIAAQKEKVCKFVSCTKLRAVVAKKDDDSKPEKPRIEVIGNRTIHHCL